MTRPDRRVDWKRMGNILSMLAVVALVASCVGVPKYTAPEKQTVAQGSIVEVYRLALEPGDLLLESIRDFIKEQDIKDGAVLTGIGSLSECRLHWPATVEYPPTDKFETFKGPLEITAIQGIIADGEPHLHMMVAEGGDSRTAGGHLEDGCKVLYLAELTIARFDGEPMTRRPNRYNVKMLEVK